MSKDKTAQPVKFIWDKHNKDKNYQKHQVDFKECEEIFFNKPLKTFPDSKHSSKESRFITLGTTNENKKLTIIFTYRNKKIRIISARNMSRKERNMTKNKKIKSIPKFKNENQERDFWATHDATEYFNFSKPIKLDVSKLKPSTKPITIRLPESLLGALKTLANKKDVPYQSLMKVFLAEKVKQEFQST